MNEDAGHTPTRIRLWRDEDVDQLLTTRTQGTDDASKSLLRHLNELKEKGPIRELGPAPSADDLAKLRVNFPNFVEAIDEIKRACALAKLTEGGQFWMPPMLLVGDPGLGKTFFAKSVARLLNLPVLEVSMAANTAGFVLTGLDLSWSTGRPGLIYQTLLQQKHANPIGILDELDKAADVEKSSPTAALLNLLESSTANTFRDEAVPVPLNAGHIVWIATANDVSRIDKPLLSRLNVIEVPQPTPAQMRAVATSVYRVVRERHEWGKHFTPEPTKAVINALVQHSPREMRRHLTSAFGNAAIAGRKVLKEEDLPKAKNDDARPGIGFMR